MARNADSYTMYAITPAGYDGTKPPPMPPDNTFENRAWTDALCGAIVKLIDNERLERPILVAHHMLGDHYALRIALDYPQKVRGAVIVSGSPSFAFPAVGTNKPGSPVKLADHKLRATMVQGFWGPFYRHMTPLMWRAGAFQARRLCRNTERAEALFAQQVSVPIPIQVRYFVEYLTTDLSGELSDLRIPLLVILPEEKWDLDRALAAYRESNELIYGEDEKAARKAWTRDMGKAWGDVAAGIRWTYDLGFQWEQVQDPIPNITVHYVDDARIFIMEDQPRVFDGLVKGFAKHLGNPAHEKQP